MLDTAFVFFLRDYQHERTDQREGEVWSGKNGNLVFAIDLYSLIGMYRSRAETLRRMASMVDKEC